MDKNFRILTDEDVGEVHHFIVRGIVIGSWKVLKIKAPRVIVADPHDEDITRGYNLDELLVFDQEARIDIATDQADENANNPV